MNNKQINQKQGQMNTLQDQRQLKKPTITQQNQPIKTQKSNPQLKKQQDYQSNEQDRQINPKQGGTEEYSKSQYQQMNANAAKYDFKHLMDIVSNDQDEEEYSVNIITKPKPNNQQMKYEELTQKENYNNNNYGQNPSSMGYQGGLYENVQFAKKKADLLDYDNNIGGGIDFEVKKISSKEEELMKKARDLENEMRQIRQAKIDVVVKQFEQQLLRDAELEEKRFTDQLRDQYECQVNQIDAEKQNQMEEINKMQKQLVDQIEFFKVVLNELEQKKSELNSTHQACIQYLRREMGQQQREQKEKLMKHLGEKKEIFKNYILENSDFTD